MRRKPTVAATRSVTGADSTARGLAIGIRPVDKPVIDGASVSRYTTAKSASGWGSGAAASDPTVDGAEVSSVISGSIVRSSGDSTTTVSSQSGVPGAHTATTCGIPALGSAVSVATAQADVASINMINRAPKGRIGFMGSSPFSARFGADPAEKLAVQR
jgi:hypothetical protein